MASLKDFKKKIKSISNTRKITRTMEMVSAAKSKQTSKRVDASTPYSDKLRELMDGLSSGGSIDHYLVRAPEKTERTALLVVTANRGLCGGYNTNCANLAERFYRSEIAEGRSVEIAMLGKKGTSRFRFRKVPVENSMTHIDDRPRFADAETIAQQYMDRFRRGEIDRVLVASTRYVTAATQVAKLTQLLPVLPAEGDAATKGKPGAGSRDSRAEGPSFIFEPTPEAILESLLPFSVKHHLYRLLLEAAASEQSARRVAMKLATDNAGELLRDYTGKYNRTRQAAITQQIMEIVGGAEALQ